MAPETPEHSTYIFTPRELQRLAVYRAAVVAGFYNDQCDSYPTSPHLTATKLASIRRHTN